MANQDFAINIPGPENSSLAAYGERLHSTTGNWASIYIYSFTETFTNTELKGALSFIQDDTDFDVWMYVVNEKAVLAPFKQELIDACVANFQMKFGVVPVNLGTYGQKSKLQNKYLVVFSAAMVYIATEFRDFTTGLRQVMYSVENSAGATTTMLNAIRYFETDFNVWGAPVVNANLVPTYGLPVRNAMQSHFLANFIL